MNKRMDLRTLLSAAGRSASDQVPLFAWLNLGIIECLEKALVSPAEVVPLFFNADNCLLVRKRFRDKAADELMSRGVQLQDLFDLLPSSKAQREFRRELAKMRSLCRKLLEHERLVA